MKSKLKTSELFKVLICLMFGITLMFGVMLSGNSKVVFAVESDAQKPTIVSVADIAIGDSNMGGFPSAIVGEEYKAPNGENYVVVATGTGPLTYSANEYATGGYGEMPQGLHLNSETGEFYGTITSEGEFNVLITVSNDYGSVGALCRIKVFNATDKPTITTESLSNGAVGSVYFQEISYSGYQVTSPTCEVVSGSLPAGLTFGKQYGSPTVYGTPTTTGTFTFILRVSNGAGTATKEFSLTISEETIVPSLNNSATIINESDTYSFVDSNGYIHVIKGKPVSVQLVSSGTNTTDNPIKYSLTDSFLAGLTMSESGLITGTPADSIEISYGSAYFYGIGIELENKKANGDIQSCRGSFTMVVHDNGYVNSISLSPETTSVAKGGQRQFSINWDAYGDYDATVVTWTFVGQQPTSTATTISNTGLLTVGLDETRSTLYVQAKEDSSSNRTASATVTIIDHTHITEVVDATPKTCTTDGNIKHYKCSICDELFEDALATQSLTAETVKLLAGHEYGTLITKQDATCSLIGMEAHYECSVCHSLFNASHEQKIASELEVAINPTAHKFGSWQIEVPATCASEGTKAHKTCEYCNKHFDNEGVEIDSLTIAKNDNHLKQADVWSKDISGHWHACTRVGCKDNGKLDIATHTKSAESPTETADVHCTICELVLETELGHTHNLQLVAGHSKTCTSDGARTYYVCSNGSNPCGHYFEDGEGNAEITENIDTWKVIPAGHTFGDWIAEVSATVDDFGVKAHKDCMICHKHFDAENNEKSDIDLRIDKLTEPITPTSPEQSTSSNNGGKTSLSSGAIVGIVIGGVVVLGIGGFIFVWFVIKKKKWVDLVVGFKKLFKKN